MNHVHGATPWTRTAVDLFERTYPDAAMALDAAVPEGHDIIVTAVDGRHGSWGAILRTEDGIVARDRYGHPTVAAACYRVLRLGREGVTDA